MWDLIVSLLDHCLSFYFENGRRIFFHDQSSTSPMLSGFVCCLNHQNFIVTF